MEENKTKTVSRPLTGEEFIESIRDGRDIWLNGERIKNPIDHPAFRNAGRSLARLYDALHDPKYKDQLTTETDTGSGGYTHKFFRVSRNADDLVGARDAIATWARLTYGQMGRSPDYKASFIGTLGANPEFYAPFSDNARRWYKEAQEKVLFFNHAIINPPVDRNRPVHEVSDVFIHVEKETDAGIIVSGAKMVATGSAHCHYNFVAHYGPTPVQKEEFALIFIAPMDLPGVKLICRPSYELSSAVMGSPFDSPLSSRFDENDTVLVFDKALIPWENVLLYRDLEKANNFFAQSGFLNRFAFHGVTRLAVKLDFISGVLMKVLRTQGTDQFRGVQANMGEVIAWRHLFWSLTDAMARNPQPGANGTVLPNLEYALAYRVFGTYGWPKVKEIIQNIVAGGLIVQTSNAEDFKNDELRPYLDKLYRGSKGIEAVEKMKLIKLLWDAVGSEYGGRHELYERNYAGNHENVRLENLFSALATGHATEFENLAEQCLSEYDLDGWTGSTWINPNDISYVLNKRSKFR